MRALNDFAFAAVDGVDSAWLTPSGPRSSGPLRRRHDAGKGREDHDRPIRRHPRFARMPCRLSTRPVDADALRRSQLAIPKEDVVGSVRVVRDQGGDRRRGTFRSIGARRSPRGTLLTDAQTVSGFCYTKPELQAGLPRTRSDLGEAPGFRDGKSPVSQAGRGPYGRATPAPGRDSAQGPGAAPSMPDSEEWRAT